MGKALSDEQIAEFGRTGILFPLPGVGAAEAAGLLRQLEALEKRDGGKLSKKSNHKPHLLLRRFADLVRDPRILDPVEDVIGPNIFCWSAGFFTKNPNDRARVTWHQDSTYWGLSSPDVVTAWVAFTPSTVETGCMRVIPGTHLVDQLPHRETYAADNLLSRGQEVEVAVDERQAVDVVLAPGQISIHHVRLIHGSEPNVGAHRRIGFAVRYVPTHVRQLNGQRDYASLVRGRDEFGHFLREPEPAADFDPAVVALHAEAYDAQMKILYAGALKQPEGIAPART